MKQYFSYKVVEVANCYYPSDLEYEISFHCKPGLRLVSVMPHSESHGTYILVLEEQVY